MELNYKTFGQGPPLIILHGLFGTSDNWQTFGKKLAEHFSVYLIDQRNHGRSPHLPEMNYPVMAEDLRQFMEANWIHEAHVLGHSMGGKTAMQLALDHPDMVDQLIVIDIAPREYSGGHLEIFEALLSLELDTIEDRKYADTMLAKRIEEAPIRQFLLKNLIRSRENGYHWKMNLPVLYEEYSSILAEIRGDEPFEGPTLFVRGGRSRYIRDEDRPQIEKLFPNYRLETIEEAGHWLQAEAPDKLLELVLRFLKP